MLLVTASALGGVSCGGQSSGTSRAQSEVRALFATVAADGRAHRFAVICHREISGLLQELTYLVKGDCPKALAAEWAEGVQLTHIASSTRILISGRTATVFDGGSPDRAYLLHGRWVLAELPRNKAHARPNEALEVAKQLNPGFRKDHLPELNEETPAPVRGAGGA
ncbi:MAG TPA: hypothetical protein VGD00_03810 [Solirubrobacteraceae bacterium]